MEKPLESRFMFSL